MCSSSRCRSKSWWACWCSRCRRATCCPPCSASSRRFRAIGTAWGDRVAEQEQNRSEPATPFRLQEARKRGSVAKSLELSSLITLFAALLLFYIYGVAMMQEQLTLDAAIFAQAHLLDFQSASVFTWLTHVFG